MLKWKIDELQKFKNHPMNFEETLDLKADLMKRDERVLDISPVKIKGTAFFDEGVWFTDFDIDANLTVPSTRSLEPVDITVQGHFTEAYLEDPEAKVEEEEIVQELEDNAINMEKAVSDNLLLSIPTRILTEEEEKEDVMPGGNEWQVISEEEFEEEFDKPKPNPEFAKLKELLNKDEK